MFRLAEADLSDIATYTLRTWGQDQAIRYVDDLEACCRRLADNPELGRACDHVRRGLRRMEYGRHVLFYRIQAKGILVSPILHQRMLPERQSIDEENSDQSADDAGGSKQPSLIVRTSQGNAGHFRFVAARIIRDFPTSFALSMKLGCFALRAELDAAEVDTHAASSGPSQPRTRLPNVL